MSSISYCYNTRCPLFRLQNLRMETKQTNPKDKEKRKMTLNEFLLALPIFLQPNGTADTVVLIRIDMESCYIAMDAYVVASEF